MIWSGFALSALKHAVLIYKAAEGQCVIETILYIKHIHNDMIKQWLCTIDGLKENRTELVRIPVNYHSIAIYFTEINSTRKYFIYDSVSKWRNWGNREEKGKFLSKKSWLGKEAIRHILLQSSTNTLSLLKHKPLVFIQTLGYKGINKFMEF